MRASSLSAACGSSPTIILLGYPPRSAEHLRLKLTSLWTHTTPWRTTLTPLPRWSCHFFLDNRS